MEIGGVPTQRVYQSRVGHDTFLVLDVENCTVTLYKTVETLLCPSVTAFEEHRLQPYYWSEVNGMMSVLEFVAQRGYEDAAVGPTEILKEMQSEIT